jgi:hypothetical protein
LLEKLERRRRIQSNLTRLGILHKDPGVFRWALRCQSVTGSIDKVFGLPFGGDISGTTAASIFVIGLNIYDPFEAACFNLMKLLPLGTMLKKQHHTVL